MDCCPPIVLPPLRQAVGMDTDDPEPQPLVSVAQPMDISAPPQLSESVRDELMHWMDAHTALTIPQRDDALARLHAAEPQALLAEPLPQHIYAALQAIDEAETQRQQSVDHSQIQSRSPTPAIPPGFEARVAARTAVAAAMTGIRRTSRISTRPTAWWTTSLSQPSGRPASSQRPGQPRVASVSPLCASSVSTSTGCTQPASAALCSDSCTETDGMWFFSKLFYRSYFRRPTTQTTLKGRHGRRRAHMASVLTGLGHRSGAIAAAHHEESPYMSAPQQT